MATKDIMFPINRRYIYVVNPNLIIFVNNQLPFLGPIYPAIVIIKVIFTIF